MLTISIATLQIGFQLTLNNSYGPLIHALPLSLSDRMAKAPEIEGTDGGKVGGNYTQDPDMEIAGKSSRKHRERVAVRPSRDSSSNGSPDVHVGGPTDNSTSHLEDFAHPASRESQQIVWIPHDPLGIGENEAAACQAQGVRVSMDGAMMNGKGRVDVDRAPPGENVMANTF